MQSPRHIKAIGLTLESLRPTVNIKAMPLAIRSANLQYPFQETEIRRVQGKRALIEIPTRTQNTTLDVI